jgi:hypothetical protein
MTTEDAAMPPAPDPAPAAAALDRAAAKAEMEQASQDFHRLLHRATAAELRRPSEGTRWTNQQLLFHMLFGYLVVRALLVPVHIFGLLPAAASKTFARLLDSARTPFHPALPLPPAPAHARSAVQTSAVTPQRRQPAATRTGPDFHVTRPSLRIGWLIGQAAGFPCRAGELTRTSVT